jgi:metal-responsive CopG/Arc/MetJ family transcriptional regulator
VTPPDERPKIARVTVNLPIRVWDAVERIAEAESISRTEALRRCISTEAWRQAAEARGAQILERYPDGREALVQFTW